MCCDCPYECLQSCLTQMQEYQCPKSTPATIATSSHYQPHDLAQADIMKTSLTSSSEPTDKHTRSNTAGYECTDPLVQCIDPVGAFT